MTESIMEVTAAQLLLSTLIGMFVLSLFAGIFGGLLVRRGLREPRILRYINRKSVRLIGFVKRPITLVVLDEVAEVLQAGHYNRNIAKALEANQEQIKAMVLETIKDDPTARRFGLVPFHDRIINQSTDTTMRVVLQVLTDPRTDELMTDLLRDNLNQIRAAVRAKQERDVFPAGTPKTDAGPGDAGGGAVVTTEVGS